MKRKGILLYIIMIMVSTLIISGCSAKTENQDNEGAKSITVTDQIGRTVVLDKPAERIVSSYYISTALLIGLGLEDDVVGIEMGADTRELYKKAAPNFLELPAVGSGKGINIEETAALEPDLVILPQKLKDSVEKFEALNIPVIVVDPETMDNFTASIELLGKVTGTEERAGEMVSYYKDKMEFVENLTAELEEKPTVYLSAGSSYLSTCTSKMYQNDLIRMAGGTNVSEDLQDGYWAQISPEQLAAWNPEYMLAVSYAKYTLQDITNDPKLAAVSAVKNSKVITFPSQLEPWDYPTPSSVLGILWLFHTLHPDLYSQEQYIEEATAFYNKYFDIDVDANELGL